MHPFTLSRPGDISAAIAAHAVDAHLAFIAGGTDLIGLMKDRVTVPDRLLDINRLLTWHRSKRNTMVGCG